MTQPATAVDRTGDATEIRVVPSDHPTPAAVRAARMADPGFGRVFTDHMVTIRWSRTRGWHDAELTAYGPLSLDPATVGLHYGQSIFEGFKAYRGPDGSISAFRPEANALRFQASARRLCLPELPVPTFVEAVERLVGQDRDWVPDNPQQSLYVRPLLIASEPVLVVRPADECLFVLIAFPAGDYFPRGVEPVNVWVTEDYVRAAPGGTGAAKCGANYAAGLIAQIEAAEHGCDQVVWTDAIERRWVEELGGMNLCFVQGEGADAKIVTPRLTGTLLPGVTRDSVLTIATDMGYAAEESRISIDDWYEGNRDGTITEVFACGTAAVVTPVGSVRSARREWSVGDGRPGPVTMQLRERLIDLQTGRAPDPHGWMHRIC